MYHLRVDLKISGVQASLLLLEAMPTENIITTFQIRRSKSSGELRDVS
jgi:hypothetical protein